MEKHKCVDCGYLAWRNSNTRELEEVERNEDRTIATLMITSPGVSLESGPIYDSPVCFTRVKNLQSEYRIEPVDTGPIDTWGDMKINQVVNRERECASFTEWIQGLTPKEHREMMDRDKMLKWQAEREEADRKWRSKQDWKLLIIAGIFTLLGALLNHWH